MTEKIPIELFRDCAAAMKVDEFIKCDRFEPKTALSAADFSGKRVDAYALAKGHITFDEVMQNLGDVPNENATTEQILGICGKFFDLQASRIDGHAPMTNIFTTIYMQKEFEIKHPVLKFMFKLFKHTSKRIEDFAARVFGTESTYRFWAVISPEMLEELEEANDQELRTELESLKLDPALEGLAKFELALAELLLNPSENDLVCEVVVPNVSSEIGCDKFMRYRDASPNTTPNWEHVPDHETAIAVMKQLIEEVAEVKKVLSELKPPDEFLEVLAAWNESREHLTLTRMIAIHLLIGSVGNRETLLGKATSDYIVEDLKQHHMPHKFFQGVDYPGFLELTTSVLVDIYLSMLLPKPMTHRHLTRSIKLWAYVQGQGYSVFEGECLSECPRCKDKNHQHMASMVFPYWSTQIAARLLWIMFRWGDKSEIYSDRDIPSLTYLLEVVMQTSAIVYNRDRLADAVYRTPAGRSKVTPRKESDILRRVQPITQKEQLASIQSDILGCCMTLEKVLVNWENLEINKGQFFDEEHLFDIRRDPMAGLSHLQPPQYKKYREDMKLSETALEETAKGLEKKFAAVKESLMSYIKTTHDQTPIVKEMMKCVLTNTVLCKTLSKENKYCLAKGTSYIFPCFELVKQ